MMTNASRQNKYRAFIFESERLGCFSFLSFMIKIKARLFCTHASSFQCLHVEALWTSSADNWITASLPVPACLSEPFLSMVMHFSTKKRVKRIDGDWWDRQWIISRADKAETLSSNGISHATGGKEKRKKNVFNWIFISNAQQFQLLRLLRFCAQATTAQTIENKSLAHMVASALRNSDATRSTWKLSTITGRTEPRLSVARQLFTMQTNVRIRVTMKWNCAKTNNQFASYAPSTEHRAQNKRK